MSSIADSVRLVDRCINDQSLNQICETIQRSDSDLQTVILRNNGLGPKAVVKLSDALDKNNSLTNFDLSGNPIGAHGANCLATSLIRHKSLQTLSLKRCMIGTDGLCSIIVLLESSKSASSIQLTHICLSGNGIDDEGAQVLARFIMRNSATRGLRIDIRNNNISDNGLLGLATAMNHNTTVCDLLVSGNNSSARQLHMYIQHRIRQNQRYVRKESFQLIIQSLRQNLDAVEVVALKNVQLSPLDSVTLAHALTRNTSTTTLILRQNQLTTFGAISIAKALKYNSTLKHLTIQDNNIGDEAVASFGQLLNVNHSLISFSIHNALGLRKNQSLEACSFSVRTARIFCQAYEHTAVLMQLHLSNMDICDIQASVILSGFSWRAVLRILDLSNNPFGDYTKHCFARFIDRCTSLVELNLSFTKLTTPGILPMLLRVPINPSISVLRFGTLDYIDMESMDVLTKVVSMSCSLSILDLNVRKGRTTWKQCFRLLEKHLTKNYSLYKNRKLHCDQLSYIRLQTLRARRWKQQYSVQFIKNIIDETVAWCVDHVIMNQEDIRSSIIEQCDGKRRMRLNYSISIITTIIAIGIGKMKMRMLDKGRTLLTNTIKQRHQRENVA